jgi:hypothetical protein
MKFSRKEIWQHNSYLGHVSMARTGMVAIMNSKTATKEAKTLASCILSDLVELYKLLKVRSDAN